MTKDEQKIKVAQIQKILGEYYGTVGRRENWDAAEEVVKLFCQPAVSGSGLVEKGLSYWIFYEEGHTYYCENSIDKRVEEINTNKEFSDDIDYEGGDTCGYYQDWADEDY